MKIMRKILLQGIFVKLDIRINSNQKFWAKAEQTTSLNSYCNIWIEGEWLKNLLTHKYFTKKFSYLKVFWPKIVLNQNFVWKMLKKNHLNLLKKNIWSDFEWKNSLHRTWGGWNSLLTKCLSYYQPVFADHVTKIVFGFLGWSFT